MQPFEVTQPNPQAQAKPAYPSAPQIGQPQGQNPQPQGQYPQPQQTGYPTLPQRSSHPQNYQAPSPSQAYQQPGGYPNYPGQPQQPQYVVYAQGGDQGSDNIQKVLMAQQMSRNIKSGGGGLVACYSLFATIVSFGIAFSLMNQNNYQVLLQAYQTIAGRNFDPVDAFSRDSCQAFLADIIAIPIFLWGFAAFNFFAMCVSFTGLTCCMFIQALAALGWAGLAVFASQQKCGVAYIILTKMFGANNIPQNAWPYYAGLAAASLVACFLNHSWSNNKDKAQRDQRSLALMMAAS